MNLRPLYTLSAMVAILTVVLIIGTACSLP